ncbi:MAG: FemAB family XrtA/PEP-CTERM system-associated protein [Bradymonadia bacterium]
MSIAPNKAPVNVTVECLAEDHADEAAWDAYVEAHPEGAVYHRVVFRRFMTEATGHRTLYLAARQGGQIVGVLPLVQLKSRIFGNYFVGIPYFNHCGALADSAEIRAALCDEAAVHAAAAGASHIELRHLGPAEGVSWPCKQSKVEMMMDLPESTEALWKGFKAKLRSQIRKPKKLGLYTRVGGFELLDDFYTVFSRNMRDLGTPVYSKRFLGRFVQLMGDRARIIICYYSGTPVGCGMVVGHRDTLEIPWASTVGDYNHLSPNMLLYWTTLKYAVEHGYRRFDFGRSTPDEGTYKFKVQWGAKPVPLHWYYWLADGGELPELNPHNPKYALAIKAWQRLPVPLTRIIGPPLVKNLP